MGCRWITVKGKRVRTAPVGAADQSISLKFANLDELLAFAGISSVSGSPTFTAEDLKHATIRIWKTPEKGYFSEARFTPSSLPIYHSISQAEATLWETDNPTPHMIAHAFERTEPPDY